MINNALSSANFSKNPKKKRTPWTEGGIHLTYQCNNNCIFCFNNYKKKITKPIPLEEAKKEVIRLKNNGQNVIHLQSNEPTVYPHIIPLIKFINKNNLKFSLTTNARLFYYEHITKQFVKMGLVGVFFSLHSHKAKVHDSLTRTPGSFNQTVKGIKNILKYDVKVMTNTVIFKQNVNDLEKIAEFFIEKFKKLHHARFSFLYDRGVGIGIEEWRRLIPSISETRKKLAKAMDIFGENGIYSFLEKMPICCLPEYPHLDLKPDFSMSNSKVKPKTCSKCKYFNGDYCVGVSHTYLRLYGEKDLIPQ